MPLKLTSNVGKPSLIGVGEVWLSEDRIYIKIEPFCKAFITREGKDIRLLITETKKLSTTGVPKVGDVYTLERGLEKLIVTVSEEKYEEVGSIAIDNSPINESNSQKQRTTLTAGIIILTLLVVSVVFGVQQKKSRDLENKNSVKFDQAVKDYELALSGTLSKKEARELFMNSKTIANELKNSGYKNSKLTELANNIVQKEAEIIGEIQPEIKEFLDLTLQTSGFNGKEIVSSGQEMFIFDKEGKNIIRISLKNKNAKIVANKDQTEGAINIGSYEDRLFLNKNDGVYEVDVITKKAIERDWNDTRLIYFYAANAYLIDQDDKQIYRFSGSSNTFSKKSEWLAPGIEADFSKVIDITIDGSIWLLSSTGKVTKLTNGNPQTVSLNGIPSPLENPTAIYTNENNRNVYILEKEKGRIVVLNKTGEFKMQYISDEIKNAIDLVVSEEEGKLILLTGPKLLYFEPKQ